MFKRNEVLDLLFSFVHLSVPIVLPMDANNRTCLYTHTDVEHAHFEVHINIEHAYVQDLVYNIHIYFSAHTRL